MSANGDIHAAVPPSAPEHRNVFVLSGGASRGAVQVGMLEVLLDAGLRVRREGDAILVDGEHDPARITYLLAQQGRYVRSLTASGAGLESVFLELTAGQGLGAPEPVGVGEGSGS